MRRPVTRVMWSTRQETRIFRVNCTESITDISSRPADGCPETTESSVARTKLVIIYLFSDRSRVYFPSTSTPRRSKRDGFSRGSHKSEWITINVFRSPRFVFTTSDRSRELRSGCAVRLCVKSEEIDSGGRGGFGEYKRKKKKKKQKRSLYWREGEVDDTPDVFLI